MRDDTRMMRSLVMRECNWMVPILLSFLFLSLSLSRLSFEEKRTDLFFVLKPPSFSFFLRE